MILIASLGNYVISPYMTFAGVEVFTVHNQ